MTMAVAPAMAQAQDPTVAQAASIIKSKAADADKQVNALYKNVKKDAVAVAGIGREYLNARDFANADKYADLAIKANKNCAAGYVLKGDICVLKDDGGQASSWFEQAIYFDAKDPEGYRRYAQINSKTDPSGSIEKLETLRTIDPNYPVDLVAADIQSRAGNTDAAIGYYDKVSLDKMESHQLVDYALLLFVKGNYEKSLKISSFGNQKFPRIGSLNRLTMYNHVNLKNYEAAIQAGDRLFNASDSVKIKVEDYQNLGMAQLESKQYDAAIATYEKVLNSNVADEGAKNGANNSISEAYRRMGDYAKAAEYYDKYIKNCKQITASILDNQANIYLSQAADEKCTAEEKAQAMVKADEIYAQIAEKFPSVADKVTYKRAHLPFSVDPEDKAGKAKPHYEKLIELLTAKSDKSATDTKRLLEAYQYLTVYNVKVADDTAKAKEYAAKIQELDPENQLAKQVLSLK